MRFATGSWRRCGKFSGPIERNRQTESIAREGRRFVTIRTNEQPEVTRRSFLNSAVAVTAASSLPIVKSAEAGENASAPKGKYETCFKTYQAGAGTTPGALGQQFVKASWPNPESSTNLLELIKLVRAGEASGTGLVRSPAGKTSPSMITSETEYSTVIRYTGDTPKGYAAWPYKPTAKNYYICMSIDPDHPSEIDATFEFWMGEGDRAEQYIKTKPCVWYNPPGVQHGPVMFRAINKPVLWLVCSAAPSESQAQCVGSVPPAFNKDALVKQEFSGARQYENCFTDIDPTTVIVPPSLRDRVVPVVHYDYFVNPEAVRTINIQIIKEGNVGFGIGESTGEGFYNFWQWPHKHYVSETMLITNSDPTKADLGGEVEFWIGDGPDAEKVSLTKRTLITIPPDTYHLPMYVRDIDSPIIMMQVTDMPIWTAKNHMRMPPGFKK